MTKQSEEHKPDDGDSKASAKTSAASATESASLPWFKRERLWGLILVLAIILVYQPVWQAGFVWDDDIHVTANPAIIGPQGLKDIWTTRASDIYPATLTTFWFEHALWGLAPQPYHLVTVLLHAACAVLLWRILLALRVPGAWLGAALWALHPVEVESVAWITETKNTQSGVFFLLSILFFVKGIRAHGSGRPIAGEWNYPLTLLFAALAMASKPTTVVLPLALGLCAWWVEGRCNWRHVVKIIPVFVMSVLAGLLSIAMVRQQRATGTDMQAVATWPERLVIAGHAIWFYLGKLLWPHPLMAIYPGWPVDAGKGSAYVPLLAVIVILLLFWWKRESWGRPWFMAFAWFLVALLPALGLVSHAIIRYSPVFDHFQYLADMGPLVLLGSGFVWVVQRIAPDKAAVVPVAGAGLVLVLGALSWSRAQAYESEETLWQDTLAKNPNAWLGYYNIGVAIIHQGRIDEAMALFQKTLAINPNYVEAHDDLGNCFLQKGELDSAVAEYRKALALNANYVFAHNNLGNALARQGKLDDAMAEYRRAIEINPGYADAHDNLGNALVQKGQLDEGVAELEKAVEIKPDLLDAHNKLAVAFLQKGRMDDAIEQCEQALDLDPNSLAAYNNLTSALLRKGQFDAAMTQAQAALTIDPRSVEAHNNLGFALLQKGQLDAAISECRQALAIDPNNAEAHYNLGNALLRQQQPDEAIKEYQKAATLNPRMVQAYINLGNALFQKRQLDGAIEQYKKALALNPDAVEALCNLATTLSQKGNLDEAIIQYQKALALNPNIVQIRDNLGTALLQKGRVDEAKAQFQAVLQMNPGDVYAQKNLARAQAMTTKTTGLP